MPSTGLRRRAELSGAFFIMGRLEGAIGVVAADASGSVEDGVGATATRSRGLERVSWKCRGV
jgi:hypothetical protein